MAWDMDEVQEKDLLTRMMTFMQAVIANNPERGRDKVMDCPLCRATQSVYYSRSPYNGHLHAGCKNCGISLIQ